MSDHLRELAQLLADALVNKIDDNYAE